MAGRTYRYFKGEALCPFGYGLSYSRFAYAGARAVAGGERADGYRYGEECGRERRVMRWRSFI